MKICIVSVTFPGDVTDGAGQVFKEYYDRLSKDGHDVIVLTGLWKNAIYDHNIIQFKVSNKKYIGLFQFIRKVKKFLKEYGKCFDIIHCNSPKSAVPVILSKKVKTICTIHDLRCFEEKGSFLERKITKYALKKSDKIITDSYEVKKQIKRFLPEIDQEKIEVLYVGINERFKNLEVEGLRLKQKLGCKKKVLLYIGRITSYKGVEYIIKAYNLLKQEFDDLTLVIGGTPDFEMKDEFEKWKKRYPDIKFKGFISDRMLPVYYSMADLFVTYSYKGEGFGLTPIESLACGTPVICSHLPIFKEILGHSAIYVPIKSEGMLYYYIKWFFKNRNINAFSTLDGVNILKKYRWDNIINKLKIIYNQFKNNYE